MAMPPRPLWCRNTRAGKMMNDGMECIRDARALHVLGVVLWIGRIGHGHPPCCCRPFAFWHAASRAIPAVRTHRASFCCSGALEHAQLVRQRPAMLWLTDSWGAAGQHRLAAPDAGGVCGVHPDAVCAGALADSPPAGRLGATEPARWPCAACARMHWLLLAISLAAVVFGVVGAAWRLATELSRA